ncbi:MAG: SlyX family protein [Mariprofundaceae bacterium]
MDERIIELETKMAYQDHTIHELSDVIAGQQKQIDALEAKMERVLEHLKAITASDIARPEEEAPPPHY